MKRKLFTFFLALTASVGTLFAESGTCGTNLTWDLTNGVLTISGTGAMDNYYSLDHSYAPWYSSHLSIKSVLINDGVTSIGNDAFYECYRLTSVMIPNSVTSIGYVAFSGCSSLTSVTIPNSVISIGYNAFYYCSSLPVIDNIRYADTYLVEAVNKSLSTYTIKEGTRFIGGSAFSSCSSLTSVTIPNSVTSIGNDAFEYCSSLTSVTIPNSVTNIESSVFYGCSRLTSVMIPNSVTSIGYSAFAGCHSLTSVTIPNSVTSIGSSAFSRCSSLTSVTIPNSVTSIGGYAFSDCSSLTSVVWNAKKCQDLTSAPFPETITSFSFGSEVEHIPAYLCSNLSNVKNIVLPCSVKSIGENAFNQSTIITKDCEITKTSETYLTLCEGENLKWSHINISNVKPLDSGDYVYKTKTILYDDSIATMHLTVNPIYKTILSDTTLCYSEDLYIDGVKCPLSKKVNQQQTWTRNLNTTEGCDSTITINVTWQKLSDFTITTRHEYDTYNSGSISYKKDDANYTGKYYYTLNGESGRSLNNLSKGNYILVFYDEECGDSIEKNITIRRYGMKVNNLYYLLDDAKHTATLTYRGSSYDDYSGEYSGNITIPKTITFDGKEYQVTGINGSAFSGCYNISSITMESETPISMYSSGLSNNCIIYVPYGSLNAYKSASGWKNYTIHVINPSHATSTTNSTSVIITLGNNEEAQHISSCGMEGGEMFAGNMLEYIGLEPESEYQNIPFIVNTKEGDQDVLVHSFTTPALELTTQPSKAVSSTTAILLAETNMSDAEMNCGFEWKRNDAPADMAGTKVYCPVASGQMAGRLKGLKDDVYYKYRAFYQSTAGNMYYGDWQYIFTGDVTVEFDPILYTYGATVVKEKEATISGYALAGSEDFTEQGFEYWSVSRADNVPNAPRRMPAALNEHHFVQASGIALRVTLTDLDAGTVYKYRVYGKVGNQYYYGTEQSFTTTGTYTPPTYTITFVNRDGTELQSSQVTEGEMPVYSGDTPVREEDDEYTYLFSGWTPTIVVATADATYTANYEATPKKSTGIEDVRSDKLNSATKILRDGHIYILREENIFTVDGREVR